jgi:hypothetical protein
MIDLTQQVILTSRQQEHPGVIFTWWHSCTMLFSNHDFFLAPCFVEPCYEPMFHPLAVQ